MHLHDVRKLYEAELADHFNARRFHSAVLECFGPLDLLEDCIRQKLMYPVTLQTTTMPATFPKITTSHTTRHTTTGTQQGHTEVPTTQPQPELATTPTATPAKNVSSAVTLTSFGRLLLVSFMLMKIS